ncbi:MAG: DnaD domain protein [Chloroflexi bacterium]|nr:DnaD domain protein [Chloroflexota bacterium]
MKPFEGFPARMGFTPVPNPFFSRLLPEISDMAELKAILYIFWSIYGKRGYPRFTTLNELAGNPGLMKSLGEVPAGWDKALRGALEAAEKRGAVIHLILERNGMPEDIYFLNTEPDRRAVARIESGELALPGLEPGAQPHPGPTREPPDIFTLYEENIGLLTPLIADELREAAKLYPEGWIRDAIKRAVEENKHKWSYIQGILERWARDGKDDGTHPGHPQKADPDKYIRGQYGHMVER